MQNWIKVRADSVRVAEKNKKDEFDRKTAAAVELKGRLLPFWKEFVGVVQQSVKDFNVEFPEKDRFIDQFEMSSLDMFTVRRAAYPSVTVKAQLNNAGTAIQYTINKTQRKGMSSVEKQSSAAFSYNDEVVAYTDPALTSHDEMVKIILDGFFEF